MCCTVCVLFANLLGKALTSQKKVKIYILYEPDHDEDYLARMSCRYQTIYGYL